MLPSPLLGGSRGPALPGDPSWGLVLHGPSAVALPGVRSSLVTPRCPVLGSGPPWPLRGDPSWGPVLPGPSPVTRPGVQSSLVPPRRPVPGSGPPRGPGPAERSRGSAGRADEGAGARAGVRSLPGPDTGRGRGLCSERRGPGRAGRGLTDLPSQLRASGAHAGAAPGEGGGAAPSGSPPRAGEKNPSGV